MVLDNGYSGYKWYSGAFQERYENKGGYKSGWGYIAIREEWAAKKQIVGGKPARELNQVLRSWVKSRKNKLEVGENKLWNSVEMDNQRVPGRLDSFIYIVTLKSVITHRV